MDGDSYNQETGEVLENRLYREKPPSDIPPVIAAAIVAIKKQVKQLGVDDKNQHGGYSFVSVDKFYERIGPLMAAQGLALLIDETDSRVAEGKSGNPWLFVQFELRFMHESGAVAPPLRRSCALPISGPQAFGAAQSYIEKQFLRQVFKIPTGERDADATAPEKDGEGSAPAGRSGARTAPEASGRTRSYPAKQQAAPAPSEAEADARKQWTKIRDDINAATTFAALNQIAGSSEWEDCQAGYVEANIVNGHDETRAHALALEVMDGLMSRIESRRAMLQD